MTFLIKAKIYKSVNKNYTIQTIIKFYIKYILNDLCNKTLIERNNENIFSLNIFISLSIYHILNKYFICILNNFILNIY